MKVIASLLSGFLTKSYEIYLWLEVGGQDVAKDQERGNTDYKILPEVAKLYIKIHMIERRHG